MKAGRHICTACNNIYEEPDHPLNCGCDADFGALPDEWRCPECGARKEMYQPCSCITVAASNTECQAYENVGNK